MQQATVSSRVGRWRLARWSIAATLLMAPAIAMQITSEVRWGPGDFLVFGGMLAAACYAFELLLRITQRRAYWVASALAVLAIFLLVWAELAIGIW